MRAALFSGVSLFLLTPLASADMDVPMSQVTAYSGGHCKYDKWGGGWQTANGDNPREHTVQKAKDGSTFASAAVPQRKGTAGLYKCTFTDQKNYPGVTFHADDHYDDGSQSGISADGKAQYDASWDCIPEVKKGGRPATVVTVQGSCGGVRGGAGDKMQRPNKPKPQAPARRRTRR